FQVRQNKKHQQNDSIIPQPIVSQPPTQDFQKMLQDEFNKQQELLKKQQTEHKAEIEKLKAELQSQKVQKTQTPVPQTVEPVRQPRGPPSNLTTEEDYKNYYIAKYFNDLGIYSKEDLDKKYTEKPFQRPRPQQKDNSRLEEKVDEIGNMLSRLNIDKQPQKPVAKTNRTQRYYPFQPISQENSGYNEEDNIWYDDNSGPPEKGESQGKSQGNIIPRTYDQLLSSLSPAMQRICKFSFTAKKSEMNCPMDSEKTNEWFESLQYLVCYVCDLTIYNTYLDLGSEFNAVNNAFGEALGWKPDLPFDFQYKGNSEHVDKSLGWYTDVPISLKDKEGKIITVTGNFARIDDGELKPMICLGM
ncbi:8092_t:CDS:2, partial [Diversispora eburnea]